MKLARDKNDVSQLEQKEISQQCIQHLSGYTTKVDFLYAHFSIHDRPWTYTGTASLYSIQPFLSSKNTNIQARLHFATQSRRWRLSTKLVLIYSKLTHNQYVMTLWIETTLYWYQELIGSTEDTAIISLQSDCFDIRQHGSYWYGGLVTSSRWFQSKRCECDWRYYDGKNGSTGYAIRRSRRIQVSP